jgi:hypothetical protein
MGRLGRASLVVVALAATSATVHAETPEREATPEVITEATPEEPRPARRVSTGRRIGAVAAAVVPGLLVRGLGSWIVHERPIAKRLLVTEGIAILVAGVGVALVGPTGGNEYASIPGVPLIVVGTGALLSSWFADIYVAAGGSPGNVARSRAPWRLDVGAAWQRDAYRDRVFARTAGRFDIGRVGLAATTFLDTGGDSTLLAADVHVRVIGAPSTGEPMPCGHRVEARAGVRSHQDDVDDVGQLVGEVEVAGRFDFGAFGGPLAGAFGEVSLGVGLARVEYAQGRTDVDTILLGGFGFGANLGGRGEARVFYDHRRDGLVGGLAAGRAAGFVGSFGAGIDVRLRGPWAVVGELQIGNGWLTTLAVGYRGGPR